MNKMFMQGLIILSLLPVIYSLTRDELIDHLRFKQETRNTFDSRINQHVKPIGYIAGKPIWPRILEKVSSPAELFFDDDNFAYRVTSRDVPTLVKHMDREENFNKVVQFLQRYTE